jgi:hypothetical protein
MLDWSQARVYCGHYRHRPRAGTIHEIEKTADEVARHLGDRRGEKWTAGEGYHSWQRRLHGPYGEVLFVNIRPNHEDRIRVSGELPRCDCRPEDDHTITVAASRTPKAIAAEVDRRLLPGYLADLNWVRERNAHAGLQYTHRVLTLERIAGLFGVVYQPEDYDPGRSSSRAELTVRGDGWTVTVTMQGPALTMDVQLSRIPEADAYELLAELAGRVKR